jgi:RNA polymerase sigma-70 factor (ECF subfamily)
MTEELDTAAWSSLRNRVRRYVARRVAASDVEDVLHDVFLRVARSLSTDDDVEHMNAWIYRIAQHAVTDHIRTRTRTRTRTSTADCGMASSDEHDAELRAALTQCMADFIAQLPSPYREAVTLAELEGLTQAAAAETMGVSLSGMKSRVQRGRARLRAMFAAACNICVDARGRVIECEPRACNSAQPKR